MLENKIPHLSPSFILLKNCDSISFFFTDLEMVPKETDKSVLI